MKRITITLTDEEYAVLERHATNERRSVREMAAYLVAKNTPALPTVLGAITSTGKLTFTGGIAPATAAPTTYWNHSTALDA